MNNKEQRIFLENILESLIRASQEFKDAVIESRLMRNRAGKDSHFSKEYLNREILPTIEFLSDDIEVTLNEVKEMRDELLMHEAGFVKS